ncbi:Transmembrane 9 superfamily member 4 [Auxenochlorella protothecoides]|uniref:Transmembrane 9 superfamily member n=3 Tax=Auxenochlorella protothecoides TaxID=3075 RepID=A0A087SG10_AUXPR|nr:Transmembrane 9 superfamily member 4 [Auxenochlorella protothecoides]KFM24664.1 Transmembrane 9 superfamily member 4 [Auxenochlorella protothecoides]
MARRAAGLLLYLLTLGACSVHAFYLPGVAPEDFKKGDPVTLKVNKIMSVKNLPYDYYSLPYCRPEKIISSAENLGEVLRGDRILNSPYTTQFRVPKSCAVLCRIAKLDKKQASAFTNRIDDEYRVNMILDNLPIGIVRIRSNQGKQIKAYERGFPVGFKEADGSVILNNHLSFTILYHSDPASGTARIVGFEVVPQSVHHKYEGKWQGADTKLTTCSSTKGSSVAAGAEAQLVKQGQEVVFTYDVNYRASNILWASRWDTYLVNLDDQIHWFSIVNSAMIVLFLSGMIAMIMTRTLRRDISTYNALEAGEEGEESGWKLVHGDVFRAPRGLSWLAACVGTGVQLLGMAGATVAFALAGFLSPANRGGLMTAMLLLFVALGGVAGYASARLYKSYGGAHRRRTTLRTALAFPGVVSAIFLALDFLIWGQRSSGAVPLGTLAALVSLWFGVSVPLCFAGAALGYRSAVPDPPVRTNKIPRQVPPQPFYLHPTTGVLVGGVLPFGAVFIELFFILSSMWQHQFYYLFGFLALVAVILGITCAEIAIVLCYFQLCAEDYHWPWRAYQSAGSSALYLFAYSIVYFVTKLDITALVPMVMYFGYMTIVTLAFFAMTGTIGYYACAAFVHKIYSAVKID